MNRPIKFRAYHINEGNPKSNEYMIYSDKEQSLSKFFAKCTNIKGSWRHDIMQFTGFKINEQDAYEGDIVTDGENNFVIEFRNGSFGVYDGKSMTVYSTSWKIIGNIHQNPELIK